MHAEAEKWKILGQMMSKLFGYSLLSEIFLKWVTIVFVALTSRKFKTSQPEWKDKMTSHRNEQAGIIASYLYVRDTKHFKFFLFAFLIRLSSAMVE